MWPLHHTQIVKCVKWLTVVSSLFEQNCDFNSILQICKWINNYYFFILCKMYVLFCEFHIFILAKGIVPMYMFIISELTKINSACAEGNVWIIHNSGRSVRVPDRVLGRSNHKIPCKVRHAGCRLIWESLAERW